MIRFFSKTRKKLLAENRLTRYLTYALGEILLIVIGILIALEINNTNQESLDSKALKGYLHSISKNLESDLQSATAINNRRLSLRPKLKALQIERDRDYLNSFKNSNTELKYSPEQAAKLSAYLLDSWLLDYLTANTSGFDSMKSSGFLSKLQGTDLEEVLLQYYNIVTTIKTLEKNHNELLMNSQNTFINANLPGTQAIITPSKYHWTGEQQIELSRAIFDILNHPSLTHSIYSPDYLIIYYENLLVVGNELKRMIDNGLTTFDNQSKANLAKVYDFYSGIGYAKVLENGAILDGYSQGQATADPQKFFLDIFVDNYLNLDFIAQPWGAYYLFVGKSAPDPSVFADFSVYQIIRIEMRGAKGGETIQISLKDSSNPADGGEAKVPITLSDEWQYYDIPLSKFHPTNLQQIFLVATFIFENDAANIQIRNIEYIR